VSCGRWRRGASSDPGARTFPGACLVCTCSTCSGVRRQASAASGAAAQPHAPHSPLSHSKPRRPASAVNLESPAVPEREENVTHNGAEARASTPSMSRKQEDAGDGLLAARAVLEVRSSAARSHALRRLSRHITPKPAQGAECALARAASVREGIRATLASRGSDRARLLPPQVELGGSPARVTSASASVGLRDAETAATQAPSRCV